MAQEKTAALVTTPSDRTIVAERTFDAERTAVFEAFTDPELIPEWWGPRNQATVVDRMEVKVGGEWRFVHRAADGTENGFHGTYREVTPPERLAYTFEWEGMPGHVIVETVEFTDLGDGRTKVTTTSLFQSTEDRAGMLDSGMEAGMNEAYEQLDELLARRAGSS
jgi:uncharacterized protein YndB with AHSA1/START domain